MRGRPAWVYAAAIAGLAILAVIVVNVIQILSKPGAEEQMRLAVLEMREASLKGRPGGVLEHMSRSLRLPPPYDSMSSNPLGDVSRFIRQAEIDSLEVSDIRPEVYGSEGVVRAHVTTSIRGPVAFGYDGPVEINFRKEVHKRLFFIPEEKWLVESFGPLDLSYVEY